MDGPKTASEKTGRGRARVIGLGLDDSGGHIRFTSGDGFVLLGGSDAAHGEMQRQAGRIMAEARRRGLCLERLTREQYETLVEIVNQVGR
jgi:hypothetical protein